MLCVRGGGGDVLEPERELGGLGSPPSFALDLLHDLRQEPSSA